MQPWLVSSHKAVQLNARFGVWGCSDTRDVHGPFSLLRRVAFGKTAKWLEDARAIASNRVTSPTAPTPRT